MWMLRVFIIALIMFLSIMFVHFNADMQEVRIRYFGWEWEGVNPLTGMLFAFAAGFLACFIAALVQSLKGRAELTARDKLIRNLKQELNGYRSQALEDQGENGEKTVTLIKGDLNVAPEKPASNPFPGPEVR